MIDFTFGSEFTKDKNPRLHTAYGEGYLKGLTAFLEFESNDVYYVIRRSFDDARFVELKTNKGKYKKYPLKDFQSALCDIIFARDDYPGFYSSDWLRRLLAFYVTILKINKKEYPDPFSYLEYTSELQLLQYHLFL